MTAVEQTKDSISFEEVLNELTTIKTSVSLTMTKTKKLRDLVAKQSKLLDKKKKKGGNREPSGFAKPTLISKELSTFLGKPPATHMARTEVTKALTEYIKEHKLQDVADKRTILPDQKLGKLLKSNEEKLTYFNLQRFLKPHFSTVANPLTI